MPLATDMLAKQQMPLDFCSDKCNESKSVAESNHKSHHTCSLHEAKIGRRTELFSPSWYLLAGTTTAPGNSAAASTEQTLECGIDDGKEGAGKERQGNKSQRLLLEEPHRQDSNYCRTQAATSSKDTGMLNCSR